MEEIRRLRREGLSVSAIARLTGHNRRTVRKYLGTSRCKPQYGPRAAREGKLSPYVSYLQDRLRAGVWNGAVLLRELREQGYGGGYTTLKNWLEPQREAARVVAVRRFETAAGQQAQVDWGSLGVQELADGSRLSLSAFVMTLGHSRAMFAQICLDEQLPTLLQAHERAFDFLGGVPREVVYDNMRTVVLGYDDRGDPQWNPVLEDFAHHWGFKPRVCQPYRPQTKGKVERGIRYLKGNFLCGRTAGALEDLQSQLRAWLGQVANARVHGTTHRQVQEAWTQERPHLQPLSGHKPYPFVPQVTRRVAQDAYINYIASRYSVPWRYAGREVQVRQEADHIEIVYGGITIARHRLATARYQVQTVPAHHYQMPYGSSSQRRRCVPLVIPTSAPQVEVRSLEAYDLATLGGMSDADA